MMIAIAGQACVNTLYRFETMPEGLNPHSLTRGPPGFLIHTYFDITPG